MMSLVKNSLLLNTCAKPQTPLAAFAQMISTHWSFAEAPSPAPSESELSSESKTSPTSDPESLEESASESESESVSVSVPLSMQESDSQSPVESGLVAHWGAQNAVRVVWQIAPSVVSLGVGMGTDFVHCPSPENRGSWEWDARGWQLKQLGASPDAHCVCTQSALSQTGHQDPTQWLEQESHQIADRRQTHRQCTWERLWYITRNGRGGTKANMSLQILQTRGYKCDVQFR